MLARRSISVRLEWYDAMIHELLYDIEKASAAKLYRIALLAALTIPDIGGARDATDGKANRDRYTDWFDKYVAPKYFAFRTQYLTGRDCYQFRCVLLHQGQQIHPNSRYTRSVFLFAPRDNIAYCGALTLDNGQTLAIDIPIFCRHMVDAARDWLDAVESTRLFQTNSTNALELYKLSFEK